MDRVSPSRWPVLAGREGPDARKWVSDEWRNAMAARKLTRKDLAEAAEKYKNWGRWGPEDEIGTLNHTSPADIVAAARLVRKGKVISLSFNYDQLVPQGAKTNYPSLGRINT